MAEQIIIALPDGEQIEVNHTVATETTLRALVESQSSLGATLKTTLTAMLKQSGKSDEEIIKTLGVNSEETKKAIETLDTNNTESIETLKNGFHVDIEELKRIQKDKQDQENQAKKAASEFQKQMGDNFARIGKLLTSLVTQLIAIGSVSAGFFFASFKNLGEGLRQLTDVGQAFGDIQSDQTQTTVDTILRFNELGITTGDAVAVLEQFSSSAAVLGQSALPTLNKEFLELTNFGVSLGVALDDATQFFQEDLAFRSSLLLRDQINQFRNAEASRLAIENLRTFSALLGRNADDLRQESRSIISADKAFQQLTVSLADAGPETQAAAELFLSGLLGAGLPADIASAFLDVATVGASGINETLRQLAPFAPELRDEIIGVGMAIRQGAFGLDDVNSAINDILMSIDTDDPGGIKQLIANPEIGGALTQTVQAIIEASVNAKNAARNFELLNEGVQFTELQDGLNEFKNILKLAEGGMSAFRNSIVVGAQRSLGELSALFDVTGDGVSRFAQIMSAIGRGLGRVFAEAIDKFIGPINDANPEEMFQMLEDAVYDFGTLVTDFFEDVINGFFNSSGQLVIMRGIANYFFTIIDYALPIFFDLLGKAFIEGLKFLFTSPQGIMLMATGVFLSAVGTMVSAMTTAITLMFAASTPIFQAGIARMFASMGIGGTISGTAAGAAGGAGASMLSKAGGVAKGLGAAGGVAMLGSDIYQGDTSGMIAGGLGAGLAIGLGLALAPFTGGGSLGFLALAGLGGGGYAIGSMIGGDGGRSNDRAQENTEALESAQAQSTISQTSFSRKNLSLGFIREATDLTPTGQVDGMTNVEARQIDELSVEAKTLIEILAQNKRSNKLLNDINKKESA